MEAGINSACFSFIGLFLIALIIFTFIYNYMLVHENVLGIASSGVCLLLLFTYHLATFGSYSIMESSITCGILGFELLGLLYLIKLVKHKKEVRYVQHFEKRFSVASPGVLGAGGLIGVNGNGNGNRTLPHQRKIQQIQSGTTPPPSSQPQPPAITISCGEEGDEGDKKGDKDEESRSGSEDHSYSREKMDIIKEEEVDDDGNNFDDRRSVGSFRGGDDHHQHDHHQQPSPTGSRSSLDERDNIVASDDHHHRQRPKTSRSQHKTPQILSDESTTSVQSNLSQTDQPQSHHHHYRQKSQQHPRHSGHRGDHKSRDHLTVPGQKSIDGGEEGCEEDFQEESGLSEGVVTIAVRQPPQSSSQPHHHHSSHPKHLPSISIEPPRASSRRDQSSNQTLHSRSRSDTIYRGSQEEEDHHHHQHTLQHPRPPTHSHSDESLLQESPTAYDHHHHQQQPYHSHHHHQQQGQLHYRGTDHSQRHHHSQGSEYYHPDHHHQRASSSGQAYTYDLQATSSAAEEEEDIRRGAYNNKSSYR